MSKSPNFLVPALGGAALVLGLAYGLASRGFGADKIAVLETRIDQVQASAEAASKKALGEAARATELEALVAEVQAAAAERAAAGTSATAPAPIRDDAYGLGRPALPEELAAWDVDVLPDGRGLPVGSGNAYDGEEIFADKCAACHGDFAEGVDNWPVLAGGFDTLADKDPVKTVGSYWPHLSTVFDYVYRSMPFGEAGTLTPDETYAIVAYILYSNDLVDDAFELSHDTLGSFEMPNKDGFVIDDRPALEYENWRQEPCMENCKDMVEVSMRSVFLVNTPPEGGTESVMNPAAVEDLPTFSAEGPSFIPAAAAPPDAAPTPVAAAAAPAGDGDALVASGEKVFRKCKACHAVGDGAKHKSGPHLNGVIGRVMGSADGFAYSAGFKTAMAEGRVWDEAALAEFLSAPKAFMQGTKMAFAGLRKEQDQAAIAAYLKSFGD